MSVCLAGFERRGMSVCLAGFERRGMSMCLLVLTVAVFFRGRDLLSPQLHPSSRGASRAPLRQARKQRLSRLLACDVRRAPRLWGNRGPGPEPYRVVSILLHAHMRRKGCKHRLVRLPELLHAGRVVAVEAERTLAILNVGRDDMHDERDALALPQ
jgi:hypothetical protein